MRVRYGPGTFKSTKPDGWQVNREANTLASKSKDASLSNDSIKIKHLVNQIRELASNLE